MLATWSRWNCFVADICRRQIPFGFARNRLSREWVRHGESTARKEKPGIATKHRCSRKISKSFRDRRVTDGGSICSSYEGNHSLSNTGYCIRADVQQFSFATEWMKVRRIFAAEKNSPHRFHRTRNQQHCVVIHRDHEGIGATFDAQPCHTLVELVGRIGDYRHNGGVDDSYLGRDQTCATVLPEEAPADLRQLLIINSMRGTRTSKPTARADSLIRRVITSVARSWP